MTWLRNDHVALWIITTALDIYDIDSC